jgi:hypothetical protein
VGWLKKVKISFDKLGNGYIIGGNMKCTDKNCQMSHCPACGECYFGGAFAPGEVCNACETIKRMELQAQKQAKLINESVLTKIKKMSDKRANEIYQTLLEISCAIDLEHKQIHVYRDGILIAIVINTGLIRFLLQYPNDLTLSMNDLEIIQDNFNAMQEMLKKDESIFDKTM